MITGDKAADARCDAIQRHIHRPVFLALKCANFFFPLYYKTSRNRLDTAGRQATPYFSPEQGRKLIADDAVENPPRLLGVHQILINGTGMGDGLVHHFLRDFIEGNTIGFVIRDAEQFFQMPGNGFSFSVRVGCKKDFFACSGSFLQCSDDFLFSLDGLIVGGKTVFNINAQFAFGKIANVSHGSGDLIIPSQIFADGLCLGGRLHDN